MKKKDKSIFRCQSCGNQAPKWMGQCPECGEWDTLVEERLAPGAVKKKNSSF
ncbi:MAG: DNA repair protein RadA, partial [Proteobacteria bacterium]|nr:DNA repair protein RadA [Pseudomonadota bacterium]